VREKGPGRNGTGTPRSALGSAASGQICPCLSPRYVSLRVGCTSAPCLTCPLDSCSTQKPTTIPQHRLSSRSVSMYLSQLCAPSRGCVCMCVCVLRALRARAGRQRMGANHRKGREVPLDDGKLGGIADASDGAVGTRRAPANPTSNRKSVARGNHVSRPERRTESPCALAGPENKSLYHNYLHPGQPECKSNGRRHTRHVTSTVSTRYSSSPVLF
jgi:hypothetical protein